MSQKMGDFNVYSRMELVGSGTNKSIRQSTGFIVSNAPTLHQWDTLILSICFPLYVAPEITS